MFKIIKFFSKTIQKTLNRFKSQRFKIKKFLSPKKIIKTHDHQDYDDYIRFQKEKTQDPIRIQKWLNDEWEEKYNGFKKLFNRNQEYLEGKSSAICLGSRTGQEVKVLLDLGIEAIGIDLVPFHPYTIEGDIHNLTYPNNSFDLIFTNILDHSLYPERFISEIERVSRSSGIIIIHMQLGIDGDMYSENIICDPISIINLFKKSKMIQSREISNSFDGMNWELILEKL